MRPRWSDLHSFRSGDSCNFCDKPATWRIRATWSTTVDSCHGHKQDALDAAIEVWVETETLAGEHEDTLRSLRVSGL